MVLMAENLGDIAPRFLNLALLAATFIFLIAGGFLLAKNILISPDTEDGTRFFAPLKEEMKNFEENEWKMVEYNHFFVNHLLSDENITKKHKKFAALLDEYRLAAMESNDCSKKIAEILSKSYGIQSSQFPSDQRSIATHHIDALALLETEFRHQFFDVVKKGMRNIIFMHRYRNKRVVFSGINAPSSVNGWDDILSKIEQDYIKFAKYEDVQTCLHARKRVRDAARKISHFLDSMTGG